MRKLYTVALCGTRFRQRKQPWDEAQSATAWKKVERGIKSASENDYTTDKGLANEQQAYPSANPESGDDPKMIRICDKLIEVFMVDKPNPGNRRRLAFTKEWDTIRPHFFERCQERADKENNPGMKPNLLRLGRKLNE
nr:DNA-directed RNA polymerase II protein [Tanacetum cinerariifolium]